LLDLLLRLFHVFAVHFCQRYVEPAVGAFDDGGGHFQIARQRSGFGGGWRLRLALRFQKQLWRGENAFANLTCAFSPGRVQLPGFARGAMLGGECACHALAIVHIDARRRYQIPHRQLRRDLSFANLLLNRLRQQFNQR
jgi:hypothetical protein